MREYRITKRDPNYEGKSTLLEYEENSICGKPHKYKNKKEAYKDYPKEHYIVQYIHPNGSYGFKRIKHKPINLNFTWRN